jgi:hypothetical protein
MAKQVRPAGGKADNKRGLRGRASDWLRLRAFHHGPERTRSNGEAEDTTAVSSSPPSDLRTADNGHEIGNERLRGSLMN